MKLLACIGCLYKVVHKIGRLQKFNRAREIEFKVVRDSFGSNRMCQFFCQNLLFMAQAFRKRNNIRGSPCSIFQKMGPNIGIFNLVKYGVNGKTVTCLPLGSDFDNF